jgi:hypothetical protein
MKKQEGENGSKEKQRIGREEIESKNRREEAELVNRKEKLKTGGKERKH